MSRDMVFEKVPEVSRRIGDTVLAGANNATLLLGRDRNGPVGSGYGSADHADGGVGAGAAHIAVGRRNEDPSVDRDAASLYLSEKTDPDDVAGTQQGGFVTTKRSATIVRADCMRVSLREDFKLVVGRAYLTVRTDGSVVIEGDIALGEGAAERLMRGDSFQRFWNTVRVPTPAGPSGPLPPIPDSVFSPRAKVR